MIYEAPGIVTFELSKEDQEHRFNEFLDSIDRFGEDDLLHFLEFSKEGFFQNKLLEDYYHPGLNRVIKSGIKLIKAFKYFIPDTQKLHTLQDMASAIIQENKIEGTLCFSVHPLDFLSSSENTYNWRSCHALDGDYRSGNLSYMVDKCTFLCYIKGENNVKLPNFGEVKWNSKKWRMLLFISEDWTTLFAGRQYPFFSTKALDAVMNIGKTSFLTSLWTNWHNDQITHYIYKSPDSYADGALSNKHICINGNIYKLTDIIRDAPRSLHFNDLLNSSVYIPYYAWKYYCNCDNMPVLNIGGEVPCVRCGKNCIASGESMMCTECELQYGEINNDLFSYCDCCDRRILIEDSYYIYNKDIDVCINCYNSMVECCDQCRTADIISTMHYNRENDTYTCHCCSIGLNNIEITF